MSLAHVTQGGNSSASKFFKFFSLMIRLRPRSVTCLRPPGLSPLLGSVLKVLQKAAGHGKPLG
ncbi:MAG TPA: hypothetical protein P5037_12740, partial [Candidatus Paceibacterota bacterium]|nr:hypothetical protein [Verrucomicrobiota bacterium]HQH03208.1 hypothetical protein [Verrucomicrobiota bacterium]HRD04688.1 hypothetical protein [Verrucomicrobiota bacterium]HRY59576.1 hypothetical protein [Candidatus Paceibacterota bacterium]HRZ70392.1 hypothetical protein [Candidatus Paceibacterota bacterium]